MTRHTNVQQSTRAWNSTCAATPRELALGATLTCHGLSLRPSFSRNRLSRQKILPLLTRVRARTNDAPFSVAHLGFATPSRVNGHTKRGHQWRAVHPGTGANQSTFVLTLPPAFRQIRAATFSSGNPRRPNTPATGHADRWWPRQSWRRPRRQERTSEG